MKRKHTPKHIAKRFTVGGILHRYFEKQAGQSASGFLEEIKTLTNDEQLELAQDAARTMGLTPSQVQFDLK